MNNINADRNIDSKKWTLLNDEDHFICVRI